MSLVPRPVRRALRPVLDSIAKKFGLPTAAESRLLFDVQVLTALRGIAASGQHVSHHPSEAARVERSLRVAFVGNIANNAWNFVKCLRRAGVEADLVLQDGWFDTYVMARPFWEEVPLECRTPEEGLASEAKWTSPPFVRRVAYDSSMSLAFAARFSAVAEVREKFRATFGSDLTEDKSLVLAQNMGHWPLLVALKDYDVVQLSGAAISLGPFLTRPYVVFPTGGDLHISPFEESILGFLMRAGYRRAGHVLLCETDYPRYLDKLDTTVPRSFSPLMVDTETYSPGDASALREEWKRAVGGSRFVVGVCRQNWEWKGNDRLLRAFARFVKGRGVDWRLVLLEWGDDVSRSRALLDELGIRDKVVWEPLCSKPKLRDRQRAADLVADQFVMEGYGTSVLESMAVGKAVLIAPAPPESSSWLPEPPPFLGARTEDEILAALEKATDDGFREDLSNRSLAWVRKFHGPDATISSYRNAWRSAMGLPLPSEELGTSNATRDALVLLHQRLRKRMTEKFRRSLPFPEELTDRWERARYLGFGDGASIYDSAVVFGNVKVGNGTWVGPSCILDGSGGLEIGAFCSIASGVHVYSHDTVEWAVSGGIAPYKRSPTRIGDACYIGPHAVVTAGVSIGKHCIVGALSMVKEDVPDNTFVAGSPARVLGRVEVDGKGGVRIVRAAAPERKGIQNG